MALKIQSSFAAGELDPALRERTNFEKYKSALATARNVIISKTGRVISPMSTQHLWKTKLSNRQVLLYSPAYSGYVIEWGHEYVRTYGSDGTLINDVAHARTESDLATIQFESSGPFIYIACAGKKTLKFYFATVTPAFVAEADVFLVPTAPSYTVTGSSFTGTGYNVDYAATYVKNGEESYYGEVLNPGQLPIAAGEQNQVVFNLAAAATTGITEARFYRRPSGGGAYGYIGSSTVLYLGGGNVRSVLADVGQAADYTHSPPLTNPIYAAPIDLLGKAICVYQQRLLLTNAYNLEAIDASRPNYQNNFHRDFPLSSDSALTFKSGTSGYARVLRMLDNDGLIVFTSVGIFIHSGALSPTNLVMTKKGNWVIDDRVPPIAIPGAILFIDASTNTVRALKYSTEETSYTAEELSVFSDHLFTGRRVVSWAFQEGDTPVLFVAFSDGEFACFTYERDQLMKAWTRRDTAYPIEYMVSLTSSGAEGQVLMVVNKDGERYVQGTIGRYGADQINLTDGYKVAGAINTVLDAHVSYRNLLNSTLGGQLVTLTPVVADEWDGPLTLDVGSATPFLVGDIGKILRYFSPEGDIYDLEITAFTDTSTVTVQPYSTFPDDLVSPELYWTATTVSGLSHLNGESVSVVVDGAVVASPNNDIENYPVITVSGGSITLPTGIYGAYITVGRPMTCDVETLDIDTVEQRPTLLESKTVNKLYIKTNRSRGLYVGNKFPDDNKVAGMQSLDSYEVDYEQPEDYGNKVPPYQSKRYELTIPGDWRSQGRICIRQVDPIPFEILSISPDVDDQRR